MSDYSGINDFPSKPPTPSLKDLSLKLSAYDPADLLAKVAGLQLSPENASRTVRLEALAHVVASLPASMGMPPMTCSRLRQICNSPSLTELSYAEDPSENVFAEEFVFFGGSYLVLHGIAGSGQYILRHISKALFLSRNQEFPREFCEQVHNLILGSLCLSNHVLTSAGIKRGTPPLSNRSMPIEVPGAARVTSLQRASSISKKKIIELFASHKLDISAIAPLIIDAGCVDLPNYELGNGVLLWKPLVDYGDELILAIPGMLVSAVRNVILGWVQEAQMTGKLATLYNKAVWDSVVKSLAYLNNSPIAVDLPPWNEAPLSSEDLFSFDSDKLLYCVLATDPLTNFDPLNPFQIWTSDDLDKKISHRIAEIEKFVMSLNPAPNALFILGLLEGIGGAGGIGLSDTPGGSDGLLLSAADLETLTLLEGGNPLILYSFAQAKHRARKRMHVVSTGILDEFHLFRSNDYSYYISDQQHPNLLVIPPGDGLAIRLEVADQRDFHAAQFDDATVEVTNLHSTTSVPLYVPIADLARKVRILVEGFARPLWVVGPEQIDGEARAFYAKIIDAVAFWLWQIQPALDAALKFLKSDKKTIKLHIQLLNVEQWSKNTAITTLESNMPVTVECGSDGASLNISIGRAFVAKFATADNGGERELMHEILLGFSKLIGSKNDVVLTPKAIQTTLDTVAPLGLKKMILMTNTGSLPQLDPRDLIPYRKLQGVKISEVLDEIGQYLIGEKKLAVGPIKESRWSEILNDVVFYCFKAIEKEIATLDGTLIHEFFIIQAEIVVRESALDRLTLPTRIECFGSVERIRKQVEARVPELAHVALASRFLVEYVAARPPSGYRPISMDFNDRLRALAHHMINFAMLSDAVLYKLQEYSVSILASGRLGIAGEPWKDAMRNYMKASAEERIAESPEHFKRYWAQAKSSDDRQKLREELDSATKEEFGHSLSEIFSLLDFLAELGHENSPTVTSIPMTELTHKISQRTQWDSQKIENLLSLLTLQARVSFLDPPKGHSKPDIYPWRYNRALSYLRRPLIVKSIEGGKNVMWGNRHLREARSYLLDQLTSGRLRPSTKGLRSLNSRLRHEEGEAFNTIVADLFRKYSGLIVKSRVNKIGNLKDLQRHLGDIDVLVVDAMRKRILVIECKSFATARTPYEMAQEVNNIFIGQGEKKSVMEKHLARTRWIKAHMSVVLEFLNLRPIPHWKVVPLIIVDQLLVAPFLRKTPIPIFTAEDVRRRWPNL